MVFQNYSRLLPHLKVSENIGFGLKMTKRGAAEIGERVKRSSLHSVRRSAYLTGMTKLLEKVLEAVRRLPPESQDEIALAMLTLRGGEGNPEEIDPAQLSAVLAGLAQATRRDFASDEQIEAAFHRFGR